MNWIYCIRLYDKKADHIETIVGLFAGFCARSHQGAMSWLENNETVHIIRMLFECFNVLRAVWHSHFYVRVFHKKAAISQVYLWIRNRILTDQRVPNEMTSNVVISVLRKSGTKDLK